MKHLIYLFTRVIFCLLICSGVGRHAHGQTTSFFREIGGLPVFPSFENTAAVTSPVQGAVIYSVADGTLKIYNGSSWSDLAEGLAFTSNEQFLQVNEGIPLIPSFTADPATTGLIAGAFYMNRNTKQMRLFNGSAWQNLIANYPPAVSNLQITGGHRLGEILTGTYDYCDIEGDAESGSTFQWYYATDVSGNNATPISGAASANYTIASPLTVGNFVQLRITPKAATGTISGLEISSAWLPVESCGSDITVNHIAGDISPATVSITYGVTDFLGQCWITRNLGATQQASVYTDTSTAAAGWYWQFNRKQGFSYDGTTRLPATTWITSISESGDWQPENDPCTLLLGSPWRLPTSSEWARVHSDGFDNYVDAYNSVLKLHGGAYLMYDDGDFLFPTILGYRNMYASSSAYDPTQAYYYYSIASLTQAPSPTDVYYKAMGVTIRCLKD